jgi:RNA polymerase-binding protein DksA
LEAQKAELAARVGKIKQDIAGGLEADSSEQASQLENQEVLDALANEGVAELAQISAALQRMDKGTYGVCVGCGQAIQVARLEARPYAAKCIDCASAAS